ncbi:feruloyl esterase, partial [Rhodoblastus sphagnicola]
DAWIYEARSGSTPASLNYSNENRHVGGSCRLPPFPYLSLSTHLAKSMASAFGAFVAPDYPVRVDSFGSNPGALKMFVYAPPRLRAGRPLVVVLHGCSQYAASFAADAGWIALARQYRFALLLPEQSRANNHLGCFNWYRSEDVRRNSGEAMSIRQMIRRAVKLYGSDPRQIFVAGFSAGGGMAAALLAAYPALIAAGGIFAGMPVGCAHTGVGALIKMRRSGSDLARASLARSVSGGGKPRRSWPRVLIWQGEKDRTVDPQNAEVLAAQWSELKGFGPVATATETTPLYQRRSWSRRNLPASVELWTMNSVGHGFPVDPGKSANCRVGTFVVDAGLSGTHMMAEFWGLIPPKK